MTTLDVSAAAAEQMRAAVAADEAMLAYHRAHEAARAANAARTDWEHDDESHEAAMRASLRALGAWRAAQVVANAADRAYQAACGDALATLQGGDPAPVDQPGLFDGGEG